MPAAIDPIFTKVGAIDFSGNLLTQNQSKDLSSGTVTLLFTADATNGSFLRSITAKSSGINIATVARFFLNNGAATTTATNNCLWKEFSLPAQAALPENVAQVDIEVPCNIALPPGYRVYVLLGTTVAAGWQFSGIGGDY